MKAPPKTPMKSMKAAPKTPMKSMKSMKSMKPMKSMKVVEATPQKTRHSLGAKATEKKFSKVPDSATPEASGGWSRSPQKTAWAGEDSGEWSYGTACYNCGEEGHLSYDCTAPPDESKWIGSDGIAWQEWLQEDSRQDGWASAETVPFQPHPPVISSPEVVRVETVDVLVNS